MAAIIIKIRITALTFVPSALHILLNLNPHQQSYKYPWFHFIDEVQKDLVTYPI